MSDDPLIALGEQWQEAYDDWQASMPPRGDGGEWTRQDDERSMKLAVTTWGLEDQISKLPVLSLIDALVKIRIAGAYEVEHFEDRHAELTRQARDGLERLVAASVIKAPVVAMTKSPIDDALNGLADSLSMVDTARHALGTDPPPINWSTAYD